MGVCNCSMFCCTLLCVRSSIAIILMGKRELIALLNLSSWCPVMVERLFLAVPQGCLRFVIVVYPDHTNLLFIKYDLGDTHEHSVNSPEKNPWKATVNKTINKYWQNDFITSSAFHSTLEFLNMKSYKLGTIHPLLKSIYTRHAT